MIRPLATLVAITLVLAACAYIGRDRSPTPSALVATQSPPAETPMPSPKAEGFVPEDEAARLLAQCGVTGSVTAYFRVPEGRDIWDYFPQMGVSPEIEGMSGLFVAVYDGPVTGLVTGIPGAPREPLRDVICVITAAGEPNIYANVSREGMVLPPGAVIPNLVSPTAPPATSSPTLNGSVSLMAAIAIARDHLSVADPASASIWGWASGPLKEVIDLGRTPHSPGVLPEIVDPQDLAWVIVFEAEMSACPRPLSNEGCITGNGLQSVFIDFVTGEWLFNSGEGPIPDESRPTPMYGSEPITDPLSLSISNGTTLAVSLLVNGTLIEDVAPGSYLNLISGELPAAPWHVEARTESGRLLLTMDVAQGDVWHTDEGPNGGSASTGVAARADLSCGRLDIWSGPPLLGPPPPSSFRPGDCDP